MSAKLGTLTLDLVAKIGGYISPIKEAEKQTQTSFSKMRDHVNTYGLAVAGAASTVVVSLAAMALETANQATELEKFAFRANSTTQEFQKMAVGAAAFGIEGDKLSDMLKDFNEKWGELTTIGAGGGVDFFEQIAMKTEGSSEAAKRLILDMQKLSGPEALQMYVNKLEEAGVTQQQMSFYLESMASDLTDLYPLLANGGEGFRLYGDMAERAGLIMTDETVESAKALKDQVYMLDLQLQGAKNQLMQAVIPAFVDISEAFLGGSEQGLQFSEVAEGVAKTLKSLASIAIGAVTSFQLVGKGLAGMAAIGGAIYSELDWYEMNPLGLVKAAYDARTQIAAVTSEIRTDMHNTVIGAAERLDQMWSGGSSEQAKQLRGIRELQQNVNGVTNGLDELADKQNKAEKAARKNNDALKEQQRLLKEQAQLRDQISYDFSPKLTQIDTDLQRQLAEIRKANFGAEQADYIAKAQARADLEKEIYLRKLTEELNSHIWTEQKKLQYSYETQEMIAAESTELTADLKQLKVDALKEQFQEELFYIKLANERRLLDAQSTYKSEAEIMQWRYNLERMELEKIKDSQLRGDLINASYMSQDRETDSARYAAWGNYRDAIGIDMSAEDDRSRREEAITEALEWELITREEYQQKMLESQSKFIRDKASLGLQDAETTIGGMTDLMGSLLGEQSAGYKAMFAVQKAAALAKVIMNAPETFSNTYNSVSAIPLIGPYIAPVVAGGALAVQLAQAAQIRSMNLSGMAHDGIDSVPTEGTWLLDRGERVVDRRTNADLKDYLASNKNSGVNININVPAGYTARKHVDSDGTVTVDIVKDMIDDAFNNVKKPNSKQSRAMQEAFGLSPAR